jgi:hypothetical protein
MADPYRVTLRARVYPLYYEEPKPFRWRNQLLMMSQQSLDVLIKHELQKLRKRHTENPPEPGI